MTAPLSVGLFTYSTLPRGSVVHTACIADALHDAGCQVTVYALDKEQRGFFRPLRARLRLVPASATPSSTAELVRVRADELSRYIERHGVAHDIHHAQDCLTANALLDARSRGAPAPVVRTVHHVETFEDPFLARCQARSILEPSRCLAVSDAARRDVLRQFGVRALRTGNGVSVKRFEIVDPRRVEALGRELEVGEGPVILAVGGVEERKNTLRLLRSFVHIRALYPRARLWILGGATVLDHGAYRAAFEGELRALPASTRNAITELGIVADEDVPAIFQLASALAFPSVHEGFGLAALEALAAGLPVVASRLPPLTEVLDDGCAALVDPFSEDDIARGMADALAFSQARRESGRARAAMYSWARVASAQLRIYRALPGPGPLATPQAAGTEA